MVSAAGAPHLTSHHRNTMRALFQHPAGHNIEWHDVVSLLQAVGSVEPRHDGKATVVVGSETKVIDQPADKDLDTETVVTLRQMLAAAGWGPGSYDDRKD